MNGLMDKVRSVVAPHSKDDTTPAHHSHLNPAHADEVRDVPAVVEKERGRGFQSSGRGGAGNMSHSRGRAPSEDESRSSILKARSTSRSRDRSAVPVSSSGRGGAGNVRSASRDPGMRVREEIMEEEDKVIKEKYAEGHKGEMAGVGRGGYGNIGVHPTHAGKIAPDNVVLDEE